MPPEPLVSSPSLCEQDGHCKQPGSLCVCGGSDYDVMNGGYWSGASAIPKVDIHVVSILWALQKIVIMNFNNIIIKVIIRSPSSYMYSKQSSYS